jgi:hypothetical protein
MSDRAWLYVTYLFNYLEMGLPYQELKNKGNLLIEDRLIKVLNFAIILFSYVFVIIVVR